MENANFGEQQSSTQDNNNANYNTNGYDYGSSSYQQQQPAQQYGSWGDADDYSSLSSTVPAKSGDYSYGYNGSNGGAAQSENPPYSSPYQPQQQYASNNSAAYSSSYGATNQKYSTEKSNLLGKIKNFGATALTRVNRKVGTYDDLDDGDDAADGGYTDLHGFGGSGGGGGHGGGGSATRHMISAMQAGWNVTNAIQVSCAGNK